ncbi:hypothetical protein XNW1_510005 [Xenorhabdus nematophila str. Websteri]|nr:hypothetical protein XNW1_4440005 [Xenorhabdus nematophila str. Websteri]CEF33787.1 hypothetical protein XNW1_510005 [Xenorhabdus nematophila str. Websteri]
MVLSRHLLVFYLLDLIKNKPFMLSPCVMWHVFAVNSVEHQVLFQSEE